MSSSVAGPRRWADRARGPQAVYADAKGKRKLAGVKAGKRAQLIEASRTLMRSACVDYEWDEVRRACVVVTGELSPCFDDDYASRWGYPAAGVE